MATAALILRYQWRAFWRRFFRTRHRAQWYLTLLGVLAWVFFVTLPPSLAAAARQLTTGQTVHMDYVLLVGCATWLLVIADDANFSLQSRRLLRFPLATRTLLGVRLLSLICSPVSWMIALGSLLVLFPLFSARHGVLASVGGLLLFALTFSLAMSASNLFTVTTLKSKWVVIGAVVTVATFWLWVGWHSASALRFLASFDPARLVTAVAVAPTLRAAFIPLGVLTVVATGSAYLLLWSFRRSLYVPTVRNVARRLVRLPRLPGKFGGLVQKEQRYFLRVLDLWLGLLVALAVSVVSLFTSVAPVVHQSVIVIICALNVNVTINCFGWDGPAQLDRYRLWPIRGTTVMVVKNLGLALIVATQVSPLLVIDLWRFGFLEAGVGAAVALASLCWHLAWGNIISVAEPVKMRSNGFASKGTPVTTLISMSVGSLPGVAVIVMLQSGSTVSALVALGIVLLTMAAYYGSLRYAGAQFERRADVIRTVLTS